MEFPINGDSLNLGRPGTRGSCSVCGSPCEAEDELNRARSPEIETGGAACLRPAVRSSPFACTTSAVGTGVLYAEGSPLSPISAIILSPLVHCQFRPPQRKVLPEGESYGILEYDFSILLLLLRNVEASDVRIR
jgi:hypothetical protein